MEQPREQGNLMLRFVGLFVAVALGLFLLLPVAAPEAYGEIRKVWLVMSGTCAPDVLGEEPSVFVMDPKGCGPSEKLEPGPKIADSALENAAVLAQTMANPQAMGEGRIIKLQWKPPLSSLPTSGAGDDLLKSAMESLETASSNLCAQLPETFATDCRVHKTALDADAARQGNPPLMQVELTYVPATAVGPLPSASQALGLYSETVYLGNPPGGSDVVAMIKGATEAADAACGKIREALGNCMIAELTISIAEANSALLVWISPRSGG
jgi:hypothetical protein